MLRAVPAPARSLARALVWVGLSIGFATPFIALAPESARAAPPEDQLTPPKLTNQVSVEYPAELLERDEPPAGTVIIEYVVATDGTVEDLKVLQSVDPVLDQVAECDDESMSRARFAAGLLAPKGKAYWVERVP